MPRIKIHNLDSLLMRIQRGESELKNELNKKYKQAIEAAGAEIARGAVEHLGKPSWELSKAIQAGKLKEYKRGTYLFKAVEAEGSKSPKPNTPAAYAWYHEHGYTVSVTRVKRGRSSRIIQRGKRSAYRKTEPKHFFKSAAAIGLPEIREEIRRINEETKLNLK